MLVGDGTKSDKAARRLARRAERERGDERLGIRTVMDEALAAARSLPHRADFVGWVAVPGRGEYRLSLGAVRRLAEEMGLRPGHKTVTPVIERQSSAFCCAFLRGLFDADGSVQGTQAKRAARLAQSDYSLLQAVQRMLLRLGIVGRIYRDRRPSGAQRMPDGKGGQRSYQTRAQHELLITGDNVAVYVSASASPT